MAELTGKNNEIEIYQHLASRSGAHPGSGHVLTLLDYFKVEGVNGENDVLMFPVIGPHLEAMSDEEPAGIKSRWEHLSSKIVGWFIRVRKLFSQAF